jgi:hypothetical protein
MLALGCEILVGFQFQAAFQPAFQTRPLYMRLANVIAPWDPSFTLLGTVASVEAIFLSTFILIRQNRMAEADRKRADLDLQVSLLAEHEITKGTRDNKDCHPDERHSGPFGT